METKENDNKPIDLIETFQTLWKQRNKYFIVLPATLVLTYLFILFIPRYYKSSVKIAPESSGTTIPGSLSSLASSFGLGNLGNIESEDAIYSEIYPDVIKSKNFLVELMSVPVETKEHDIHCDYYTWIRDHQKFPWWIQVYESIKKLFVPVQPDTYSGETLSVFYLTKRQTELFDYIQGNIKCVIDKKTNIISIIVKDQDPLICATMAEATCKKLQEFIINYRTNKNRIDYEYYKKLCKESKAVYEESVKVYAAYADANRNTIMASHSTKEDALENEMQANYSMYTAMKAQMQAAEAKLQEATPAFTIIESASIAPKPAGPRRLLISVAMTILACIALTGWLLLKKKN